MRYFLEIAYDGTDFHGWQKQLNGISVQQEIEVALSTLLRRPLEILGAGRTDSGVHAIQQFAHFDCDVDIIFPIQQLKHRLNRLLPSTIAVNNLFVCAGIPLHARFDAISRAYVYKLTSEKCPFSYKHIVFQPRIEDYDWQSINEATNMLLEWRDFASFCKLHGNNKTTLCKIISVLWEEKINENKKEYHFHIKADRFLRGMVRGIVGTLLEIGSGKRTSNDFFRILEARNRSKAGANAPAHGLYLSEVNYPKDQLIQI